MRLWDSIDCYRAHRTVYRTLQYLGNSAGPDSILTVAHTYISISCRHKYTAAPPCSLSVSRQQLAESRADPAVTRYSRTERIHAYSIWLSLEAVLSRQPNRVGGRCRRRRRAPLVRVALRSVISIRRLFSHLAAGPTRGQAMSNQARTTAPMGTARSGAQPSATL